MLSPRYALAFAVPVVLSVASCADLAIKQDLDPQLTDLQETRAALESQLGEIAALVASVEADVASFVEAPVDSAAMQSPEVAEAVASSMDAEVDANGDVIEASSAAKSKIEAALAHLDADSRAQVQAFMDKGSELSARLKSAPAALQDLVKSSASAAAKIASAKAIADQKVAVAEDNPLMTDADKSELASDSAVLEAEITELEALADRVTQDAQAYGARLASAMDRFNQKVASLE